MQWLPVHQQGRIVGTGFEAVDLMVACNDIDGIIQAMGHTPGLLSLVIVIDPVENDTRFQLPEEEFNQAIYGQLLSNAPLMRQIIKPNDSVQPHMYLMGRLQRVIPDTPRDHEILLYSYRMVDASNNEVIWEGSCEVKTHLDVVATETALTAQTSVEM
jgi:hypothetical protein